MVTLQASASGNRLCLMMNPDNIDEHNMKMELECDCEDSVSSMPEQQISDDQLPDKEEVEDQDFEEISDLELRSKHMEHMQGFVDRLMENPKCQLISDKKYDRLLAFLKDPKTDVTPSFKYWASTRNEFKISTQTLEDGKTVERISASVVIQEAKSQREVLAVTMVPTRDIYSAVEEIHVNWLSHAGYKRVKQFADHNFYGITRTYIQEFCRTCPFCCGSSTKRKHARIPQAANSTFNYCFSRKVLPEEKLLTGHRRKSAKVLIPKRTRPYVFKHKDSSVLASLRTSGQRKRKPPARWSEEFSVEAEIEEHEEEEDLSAAETQSNGSGESLTLLNGNGDRSPTPVNGVQTSESPHRTRLQTRKSLSDHRYGAKLRKTASPAAPGTKPTDKTATSRARFRPASEPETRWSSASGFMDRIHVDVMDLTGAPDGKFTYIGHVVDGLSNYHVLFPLLDNSPAELASALRDRVFSYFGPPRVLHICTGAECISNALPLLLSLWPDIAIIQGKSDDTMSPQQMRERVTEELQAIQQSQGISRATDFPWSQQLAKVMFKLNCSKPSLTQDTPYGVVFGQAPHSGAPLPGMAGKIIQEEQLERLIGQLNAS